MISVLYDDDYSKLNILFDKIYQPKKSNYVYVSYSTSKKEKYNKKIDIDMDNKTYLKQLIQNTQNIASSHNFNIDPNNYYVEFHKYFVNGKTIPFTDFHEDDYGAVSYNTVTCIYYLIKNDTIEGGDLEFKNKDKGIIKIDPNMLVIFNGNLVHRVTKMNGSGIRKCIVIQFRRL